MTTPHDVPPESSVVPDAGPNARLDAGPNARLDAGLDLVGERTVPGLAWENYWFRRHQAAYRALGPLLAANAGPDGPVIEAGSGEGYGVGLLRDAGAERVLAIDYDAASVRHARAVYPKALNGRILRANLVALPLATASTAAVASFQVIEHLWNPMEFLTECVRVLQPGGLLVVTTPNRITFSPGLARGEHPPNPYHHREFDADELQDLITTRLTVTASLGLRHGPRLRAWQAQHGDPVAAQLAVPPAQWSAPLRQLIESVGADDFELGPLVGPAFDHDVLDLVVLARRDGSAVAR